MLIGEDIGQSVPFTLACEFLKSSADVLPAEELESPPIGRSRVQESEHRSLSASAGIDIGRCGTGDERRRRRDLDVSAGGGDDGVQTLSKEAGVRVGGVGHQPVGDIGREFDGPIVDTSEPESRAGVGEGSRVEERLQSSDRVIRVLDVKGFAGRERMPCGAHDGDVVAHPRDGTAPRHSETTFDVLSNL